ncbi:hypothetical protein COCVIDRAFT_107169 [Bipolaris victoriae FI3]|uniref:Uncharacterized protein n=1 Tax=Bipolaris victoriae (strain FI3) TaxID=930091 RepID=W7E7F4_BIPV3|nr:hypothetical protein COCVIDRAFT_107169 [Bipolaris victoriae FI3]
MSLLTPCGNSVNLNNYIFAHNLATRGCRSEVPDPPISNPGTFVFWSIPFRLHCQTCLVRFPTNSEFCADTCLPANLSKPSNKQSPVARATTIHALRNLIETPWRPHWCY